MTENEPVPHTTKRLATAMMLLSLLGVAGCMSWQRAVPSAANDVQNMIHPPIDPAEDKCEQFGCEP